ncbi:hypothetical protein D3C75_1115740 [compost metagenome]
MVEEDAVVAAIAEKGSSEFPYRLWGLDPARCLGIEAAERLKRSILGFRQQRDAHLLGHLGRRARRPVLLPGFQRGVVIAEASAPGWALGAAVTEDELPGPRVLADDIGFTAAALHLVERGQRLRVGVQPGAYL